MSKILLRKASVDYLSQNPEDHGYFFSINTRYLDQIPVIFVCENKEIVRSDGEVFNDKQSRKKKRYVIYDENSRYSIPLNMKSNCSHIIRCFLDNVKNLMKLNKHDLENYKEDENNTKKRFVSQIIDNVIVDFSKRGYNLKTDKVISKEVNFIKNMQRFIEYITYTEDVDFDWLFSDEISIFGNKSVLSYNYPMLIETGDKYYKIKFDAYDFENILKDVDFYVNYVCNLYRRGKFRDCYSFYFFDKTRPIEAMEPFIDVTNSFKEDEGYLYLEEKRYFDKKTHQILSEKNKELKFMYIQRNPIYKEHLIQIPGVIIFFRRH